ncbi:TrkH-domain-containing protein [Lentinus tigrinus ALCF2SS1-7]|uniref:Potassium transport protein n=1 Tax=Lentinus tigrinus ALCF2SS1-6 TaxID=1328759 RepID=A0A5C2RYF4_9APHY|nr:TrkH-domain-containing protein [Lentinus tigrinus ALCF2SS1-6]RPD74049.1 TrkH-domain-containing protein [Lentinus tigrinus ALCF2SS1-7]
MAFIQSLRSHLNFYRLHLLGFVIVPLIGAAILFASNGEFSVRFIDALYICVSGATGTGLVTVDLSSLTVWQQVILVILELIGNQAFVAWVVVYVRRWYFLQNLKHIVKAELSRSNTIQAPQDISPSLRHIRETLARLKREGSDKSEANPRPWTRSRPHTTDGSTLSRDSRPAIRPEMVRRLDIAPHLINPMGSQAPTLPSERMADTTGFDTLSRAASRRSLRSSVVTPSCPNPPAEDDFGGFPGPRQLLSRIISKLSPRFKNRLKRTLTVPRTETLVPRSGGAVMAPGGPVKPVPYLSFSAIVRNSTFHGLSEENIEELGGVEYRALSALLWIIPLYYLGFLSVSFIVTAPYMSLPRWQENYLPPLQHKKINPVWFTAFQIVGAWANTGMSLVDQNMVPFQTAYPLVIFLVICVLAGNTCLPIFLRLHIWLLKKLPGRSRMKESLHFLLDHPRRCTIYLFPSRQTWLLFGIVMVLNCTNLLFDLVLNIGNPATEAIPLGVRIIDAILNAAACRNAGYQPIPVSELMPAVQVLSVIMMYISIYPIAMSVRATNVYEAKSLGVYSDDDDDGDELDDDAHWNQPSESRVAIWGKYLMRHARRQLSFDMWWLAVSLFLLCIIERDNLIDPAKQSYFNIFALIFEIVSAYGTVGLSLGIPGFNYALSGGMHTLSKLIIVAVMLRGRHRGLPVALDRAVLMPSEFLPPPRSRPPNNNEDNKGFQHETELADVPSPLRNPEELQARMRMRTRTISLVVEERRDQGVLKEKDAGMPPWVAEHIPEGSQGSSVEGGEQDGGKHAI